MKSMIVLGVPCSVRCKQQNSSRSGAAYEVLLTKVTRSVYSVCQKERRSIGPPDVYSCFRFCFAKLIVLGTRRDVRNK
jgi:hypothetical protein